MCRLISSFSVSFELALWLCFPLFSASHVPRLFFLVSAVATNLSDISRVSRNIFLQTFTFFSWICRKYSHVELLLEPGFVIVVFSHFSGLCCISIVSAVSNNPFSKNCEKIWALSSSVICVLHLFLHKSPHPDFNTVPLSFPCPRNIWLSSVSKTFPYVDFPVIFISNPFSCLSWLILNGEWTWTCWLGTTCRCLSSGSIVGNTLIQTLVWDIATSLFCYCLF